MKKQKIVRIVSIIVIVVAIVAAMVASFNQKPSNADMIWDEQTIIGNKEAKNYFIIYSDIVCPYCVAFENAIIENKEDFERYIADNDVLVEIRLSDFLYEHGASKSIASRYSAEAVYCAKNEGKFWDYYEKAITTVWNDYFKESGKSGYSKLNSNTKDYWIEIGKSVGLSDKFEKCVKEDEPLEEVVKVSDKMAKNIDGLPYFKFNKYISSGFDMSWGYDYVKMYFDSGLKSK
ncbi:thioredoxin domain-containing protein [Candidatus Saccharibacteria bacterium]|nr:thioredoxin domain-containing protein [Candidatus Saccharibacteria bacterium]